MSDTDTGQSGAGRREVAYRVLAAEYEAASYSYSAGDEERAPNYVVTPTGARVNRLFLVGVLTETEEVSDGVLRARVSDPTDTFVLYAGQYQPDEQAMLEATEPPAFLAVTGKARTFQPDDTDQVYTSVRPESINKVDARTRDRWTVQAAEQTLVRIGHLATALSVGAAGPELRAALVDHGVDTGLADGITRALEQYGTSTAYLDALRETAVGAAGVVAGERDKAAEIAMSPDTPNGPAPGALTDLAALGSAGDGAAVDSPAGDKTAPGDRTDQESPTAPGASTAAADNQGETVGETTADTTTDTATTTPPSSSSSSPSVSTSAPSATSSAASTPASADAAAGAETETKPEPEPEPESGSEAETDAGAERRAAPDSDSDSGSGDTPGPQPQAGTQTQAETPDLAEPAIDDTDGTAEKLGSFESEFELEADERKEIEAEYGTEFQSGTDIDDPGNADIEAPEPADTGQPEETGDETEPAHPPDPDTDPDSDSDSGPDSERDISKNTDTTAPESAETGTEATGEQSEPTAGDTDTGSDTGADTASDQPEAPADPEDALVGVLRELDNGSGADRAAVIETMADRHGLAVEETEETIQAALMSGRCYEPDDESLKPI